MPLKGVSQEINTRLETYAALLVKWQKKINLVGKGTLGDIWTRHFSDSAQLSSFIPSHSTVFDIGSGAGFPGMVLAILRPDSFFHLIESDQKKCAFLQTVSRETRTRVQIHCERIVDVSRETTPNVVTARALAPLPELLNYCALWIDANPDLTLIFSKGEKAECEIKAASEKYAFLLERVPSETDTSAEILVLKNVHGVSNNRHRVREDLN